MQKQAILRSFLSIFVTILGIFCKYIELELMVEQETKILSFHNWLVISAQLRGGQISPSQNWKKLSRPIWLLIRYGIVMQSSLIERKMGVHGPLIALELIQYWSDWGPQDLHFRDINHHDKVGNDLLLAIYDHIINILHQPVT